MAANILHGFDCSSLGSGDRKHEFVIVFLKVLAIPNSHGATTFPKDEAGCDTCVEQCQLFCGRPEELSLCCAKFYATVSLVYATLTDHNKNVLSVGDRCSG